MRRRTKGQSMVEMALLLPLMLVVLFGIIDFGWYVYGYATVYMASRSGAEKATMLPPLETRVGANVDPDSTNQCVSSIYKQIAQTAPLFEDIVDSGNIRISYPDATNKKSGRLLGSTVEVKVSYDITPLTPLFRLVGFGNEGALNATVTTRRTIESLGDTPNANVAPNFAACN